MGQRGELQVCDKPEVGWKRIRWGISEFYGCGWCVCVVEFCLGEPEECPCRLWKGKKELLSSHEAMCP